jgi:hypothetical protein
MLWENAEHAPSKSTHTKTTGYTNLLQVTDLPPGKLTVFLHEAALLIMAKLAKLFSGTGKPTHIIRHRSANNLWILNPHNRSCQEECLDFLQPLGGGDYQTEYLEQVP